LAKAGDAPLNTQETREVEKIVYVKDDGTVTMDEILKRKEDLAAKLKEIHDTVASVSGEREEKGGHSARKVY
jgi:hypothetical protein